MNYFSKRNIVVLIIAVLLTINIASISTIVYHSYDKRKAEEPEVERTSMRVFRQELNLNQKQIEDFGVWGRTYRDDTKEILIEMRKIRISLFNEMSSANPDTAKMFAMADEIGEMHAQIKRLTIDHFLVIKENSTPEQFEKFVKLFQRALMDDDFGRRSERQGRNKKSMNGRSQKNRNNN
jgi:Spy/CpxP family protein refolding chaperone